MSEISVSSEVFARRLGALMQIDSSSDADAILGKHHDKGNIMRFRLTYSGELKAAGNNNNRSAEKWTIRNQLHPQLEELWQVDSILQGKGISTHNSYTSEGLMTKGPVGETLQALQRERLRRPVQKGGRSFLPLVRKSLDLTCSLDILFLRKDSPGSVVSSGGDLDARMKLLFDGLRMPTSDEVALGMPVASLQYCLLEDDVLITDVAVRTDRLLSRPDASISEVLLIVDVLVEASEMTEENMPFCFPIRR